MDAALAVDCSVRERCGGCPLMQHAPDEQRRLKLARVAAAFAAVGVEAPEPGWSAGPDRDYRNRLRLRIDAGQIGFFNPEKHMDCTVLEPSLRETVAELHAVSARMPDLLRAFAWVEARSRDANGVTSACVAPHEALDAEGQVPETIEVARQTLQANFGERALVGVLGQEDPPMQRYRIEGADMHVALGAFLQVNHHVNSQLVQHVLAHAERGGATEFVDLYAGSGNFALPLAARGLGGIAVESCAASIASLRASVARSELSQLRVLHSDVASVLPELALSPSAFVIADPPRAGLGDAARELHRLCTQTLLLVSCNPKSLARDVANLTRHFRLAALHAFDMFPHTEHIELVAQLARAH